VEDLDADLENISDSTLGPISILPRGGNFNQQNASNNSSSKLVLSVPVQDQQQMNPTAGGTLVNMNNPDEYGY